MKKSTIWLLTLVMSLTFGALLYFQISYLENMAKMREAQFSETVLRCMSSTSLFLEKKEALHYLEQDINSFSNVKIEDTDFSPEFSGPTMKFPSPTSSVQSHYKEMQEAIRSQYLYQKGLLNEVIINILRDSGSRPVFERADSTAIRQYMTAELESNGLDVPFVFAVKSQKGSVIYASPGFNGDSENDIYTQTLFPNTESRLLLAVEFPTKSTYIYSSVRFIIPALAFSLILLVIFLYTILLAFRQKKLTEMKTDFINNMTHELKTPISTISLAAQMLGDSTVTKSPASLKHLSQVITDESKRLRFQVEKVLQMSMFNNQDTTLNFVETNANEVIKNVVQTFKIKVEKFGGSLTTELRAADDNVLVDQMHFTNIIYNLLDNAVKYMREEVEPRLLILTENHSGKLIIKIRDNGIGIKKEDQKKIFEKFYRVPTGNRHDVKGFGLGLAYVKRMVGLFGGFITVESEPGKGSTFIISVPTVAVNNEE